VGTELLDPKSPTGIKGVAAAALPELYDKARKALEACANRDEVKEWADKAQAIASYAKQMKDTTLRKTADRIIARAKRRYAELMTAEFGKPKPGRPPLNGADPQPVGFQTRAEAEAKSGLSRRQARQVRDIGEVPQAEFDKLVDAEDPATPTQLAKIGEKTRKAKRPPKRARTESGETVDTQSKEYKAAGKLVGFVASVVEEIKQTRIDTALKGLTKAERAKVLKHVTTASTWFVALMEILDRDNAKPKGKSKR
jgi:hypothetical protein